MARSRVARPVRAGSARNGRNAGSAAAGTYGRHRPPRPRSRRCRRDQGRARCPEHGLEITDVDEDVGRQHEVVTFVGASQMLGDLGMDELPVRTEPARLLEHVAGQIDAVDTVRHRRNERAAQPGAATEVERGPVALGFQTVQTVDQGRVGLVVESIEQMALERLGVLVEERFDIGNRRGRRRTATGDRGEEIAVQLGIGTVRDGLLERDRRLVEPMPVAQDAAALAPCRTERRIEGKGLLVRGQRLVVAIEELQRLAALEVPFRVMGLATQHLVEIAERCGVPAECHQCLTAAEPVGDTARVDREHPLVAGRAPRHDGRGQRARCRGAIRHRGRSARGRAPARARRVRRPTGRAGSVRPRGWQASMRAPAPARASRRRSARQPRIARPRSGRCLRRTASSRARTGRSCRRRQRTWWRATFGGRMVGTGSANRRHRTRILAVLLQPGQCSVREDIGTGVNASSSASPACSPASSSHR